MLVKIPIWSPCIPEIVHSWRAITIFYYLYILVFKNGQTHKFSNTAPQFVFLNFLIKGQYGKGERRKRRRNRRERERTNMEGPRISS
jgi:hypothetical protein